MLNTAKRRATFSKAFLQASKSKLQKQFTFDYSNETPRIAKTERSAKLSARESILEENEISG